MVISISSLALESMVQISSSGFITWNAGEASPIIPAVNSVCFDGKRDLSVLGSWSTFSLKANLFQVQDDVGHVFRYAFNGGKFVIGTGDVDSDDCISFQ